MKLSKENIQLIDNYLKNSKVVFYDIRMEMIDHIATAIEQKMQSEGLYFQDAFKGYMVLNKKEILNWNKDGSSVSYSKEAFKKFFGFITKPYMIIVLAALLFFFNFVEVKNYFSESFSIHNLFTILVISVALFQIFYFLIYLKERFYVLEKAGGILMILYYAQIFFSIGFKKESPYNLILAILFYFLFAYIIYFIREVYKFHKKQFIK